jgi:hypothetical protein
MNLDDLIPQVILEAPEVPDPVASLQIVLAARELCSFSLAWQADVTFKFAGKKTVPVSLDEGELVQPISATYSVSSGGTTSHPTPATPAQLDLKDPSWRTRVGPPTNYFFPTMDTVQFVPTPPQGTAIVRVAVQPGMTEKTIDDRVGSVFREAIVHGALARLFRIPSRQWTDKGLAAYHLEAFELGKADAQNRGVDMFAKVARKVKYGGL